MGRGRRPSQRTTEERLALRRERVRLNVQAHRERQRLKRRLTAVATPKQPELRWVQETRWQDSAATDAGEPSSGRGGGRRELPLTVSHVASDSGAALLREPRPGREYAVVVLALFRNQFLPDRVTLPGPGPRSESSRQQLTTPCAPWVVKAYELAAVEENTLVQGMLHSLGLGLLGAERRREDLQMVSLRTYQRTLSAVSRRLGLVITGKDRLGGGNVDLPLMLSCHAAAIFELSINGSLTDSFRHVQGLGSLLEHQIRVSETVPDAFYDLLDEYRLFELVYCLMFRRTSALSGNVPATAAHTHRRVRRGGELSPPPTYGFVGLVSIGRRIPPVMVQIDNLKSAPSRSREQITPLANSLTSTLTQLQEWFDHLGVNDAQSVLSSTEYIYGHGDLEFPSLDVAAAWTFCLSFRLLALDNYISLLSLPSTEDQSDSPVAAVEHNEYRLMTRYKDVMQARDDLLETAKLVVRTIPYYFVADIGFIGRSFTVFPLECARLAFVHEFDRESVPSVARAKDSIIVEDMRRQKSRDIADGLMKCGRFVSKAKSLEYPLFSGQ